MRYNHVVVRILAVRLHLRATLKKQKKQKDAMFAAAAVAAGLAAMVRYMDVKEREEGERKTARACAIIHFK